MRLPYKTKAASTRRYLRLGLYFIILSMLFIEIPFSDGRTIHVALASPPQARAQQSSQLLTINLFEDRDVDGVRDATDPGVANITVNLFDVDDPANLPCATKQSGATGTITFSTANTAFCAGNQLYMEVDATTLPAGMFAGPVNWVDDDEDDTTPSYQDSESDASVMNQIVDLSSEVVRNIGVVDPTSYTCNPENAYAMTTCYVNGDSQPFDSPSHNMDALVGFPYLASGAAFPGTAMDYVEPDHLATMGEIGATWGLAWSQQTEQVYVGAVLKRHVALGPLGLGGIYRVDFSTGTPAVEEWLNIEDTLGVAVGQTVIPDEAARALPTGLTSASRDAEVYPLIGMVGIGDVDLVTDEGIDPAGVDADGWIDREYLLVVDLNNKDVLVIDPTTQTLVMTYDIPAPSPACANGTHRPWAIDYVDGTMYVGLVCDGSTESAAVKNSLAVNSNLEAIVYKYDLTVDLGESVFRAAPTVAPETILRFPLDYEKGSVWSGQCPQESNWHPWRDDIPPSHNGAFSGSIKCWPTPVLVDIDFSDDGNMLLAFMDRSSHQWGWRNYSPSPTDTKLYRNMSGGDILMACPVDGTYVLENDATCGSLTSANTLERSDGPGGKEFFYGDAWPEQDGAHQETANNGIAVLPGANEVIAAGMDPFGNAYAGAGGINWYNTQTGAPRDPGYMLYASQGSNSPVDILGTAGKSGGLGDVDLICPQMPITIGDTVWLDADEDGVQDPDEAPMVGVTVYLQLANGSTVSTVSDINGRYYFEASRNQEYTIAFDVSTVTGLPSNIDPSWLVPTISDSASGNDANDSDLSGTLTVNGQSFPSLSLSTNKAGESNHDSDAGFKVHSISLGDYVWHDVNGNGIQDTTESGLSGVTVELVSSEGEWLFCANEFQVCQFSGTTTVRYGMDDIFAYKDATDLVTCDSQNFGDPLPGVSKECQYLDNSATTELVLATTTTDANGYYHFDREHVPEGIQGDTPYELRIALGQGSLLGYTPTRMNMLSQSGNADEVDSDAMVADGYALISLVTATGEFVNYSFDFGFGDNAGQISGEVWNDLEANGIQNPIIPLAKGVPVSLMNRRGDVVSTTDTGNDGLYRFTDLPEGEYILEFKPPVATAWFTLKDQGTDEALDSDVSVADGRTDIIALSDGGTMDLVDAGLVRGPTAYAPQLPNPGDQINMVDQELRIILEAVDDISSAIIYEATNLPPGLSIGRDSGQISGTPTTIGVYDVLISVKDGVGGVTTVRFQWTISDYVPIACNGLELEAEDGLLSGDFVRVVTAGQGASGGQYVMVTNNTINEWNGATGSHTVTFCVNVETAGIYRLNGGVKAVGSSDNSFYVQVDGAPARGYVWEIETGSTFVNDYVNHASFDPIEVVLKEGQHTITVHLREDGTKLDKMALELVEPISVEATCDGLEREAESGILEGRFSVIATDAASGGLAIVVPNGLGSNFNVTNSDSASYCFTVPTSGEYLLQAVIRAPNVRADSFWVTVDGTPSTGYLWDTGRRRNYSTGTLNNRGGDNPVVLTLAEGEHTVTVYLREDGTFLDKLMLVPNASVSAASFNLADLNEPINGTESGLFGVLRVPANHREDPTLAGIPVTVSGNGIEETAETDVYGRYYVDDVSPGEYTVQLTLPSSEGGTESVQQSVTVDESSHAETSIEYAPPSTFGNIFIPMIQGRTGLDKTLHGSSRDTHDDSNKVE